MSTISQTGESISQQNIFGESDRDITW